MKTCPKNNFQPCRVDCAWFDEDIDECAILSISMGIDLMIPED